MKTKKRKQIHVKSLAKEEVFALFEAIGVSDPDAAEVERMTKKRLIEICDVAKKDIPSLQPLRRLPSHALRNTLRFFAPLTIALSFADEKKEIRECLFEHLTPQKRSAIRNIEVQIQQKASNAEIAVARQILLGKRDGTLWERLLASSVKARVKK